MGHHGKHQLQPKPFVGSPKEYESSYRIKIIGRAGGGRQFCFNAGEQVFCRDGMGTLGNREEFFKRELPGKIENTVIRQPSP
jgi:hypothetical protein